MLSVVGGWVAVLFRPLGFGNWQSATALITGFMAKESVVSTLKLVATNGNVAGLFPSAFTAFVFLLFILLYTPCVAAIAAVKRELGKGWAITVVLLQCALAWLICLVVVGVGALF